MESRRAIEAVDVQIHLASDLYEKVSIRQYGGDRASDHIVIRGHTIRPGLPSLGLLELFRMVLEHST